MRAARGAAALAALALAAGAGCTGEDDEPQASQATTPPVALQDHWHAAFGIFVCDRFLSDPVLTESPVGIHTHGDGVIHIHPTSDEAAGANATLGVFLDRPDIDLEDGGLEVDGVTWFDGEECDNGRPARVVVARWDDAATGGEPEIVTEDFTSLRFRADGEAFTVAFVPDGADIPLPPSAANLVALGQIDSSGGSGTTMTTGVPESELVAEDGFYPVVVAEPPTGATCPAGSVGAKAECLTLGPGAVGLDAVADAEADVPQGQWLVRLRLTDEGIDRFNELARRCHVADTSCASQRLAIVVDGRVQSTPTITEPSYEADQIQISGSFTEAEARALAEAVAG